MSAHAIDLERPKRHGVEFFALTLVTVFCSGYLSQQLDTLGWLDGSYSVYAEVESSSSLQSGSRVEIEGIAVGRVAEILFAKGDVQRMELKIRKGIEFPEDSSIKVVSQGIRDRKFLSIEGGLSLKNMAPGGTLSEFPPAGPMEMESIARVPENKSKESGPGSSYHFPIPLAGAFQTVRIL